jgi:hypothetical protein
LTDGITVSVLIDSLNHDVSNVLSSLDNCIQVLIVSAADSHAFAGVSNDFLIIDNSDNLYHLFKEISSLQGKDDSLVLSQATRETSDKILDEWLGLLLDAQSVQEL